MVCVWSDVISHFRLEVMVFSALTLLIIPLPLDNYQLMDLASLHHTRMMLILVELVKYIIVRVPVLFSLLEQVVKYKQPLLIIKI